MRAFAFPLERVLSWRRTQLALEETQLEVFQSDLRAVEAAVRELTHRNDTALELITGTRSFSGADVADMASRREWAIRESRRLAARMVDCRTCVETQAAAVTEARRRVRLLERLRERRHQSWKEEFDRELDHLASESAISAWRREQG